jgi:hypothetical protein
VQAALRPPNGQIAKNPVKSGGSAHFNVKARLQTERARLAISAFFLEKQRYLDGPRLASIHGKERM